METTAVTVQGSSATQIERIVRGFCARRRIARIMQLNVEKYVDDDSGMPYYYNRRTTVTTWEKPKLLGDLDAVDPYNEVVEQVDQTSQDEVQHSQNQLGIYALEAVTENPEPPPVGIPSTAAAMHDAWRLVLPQDTNPHDAQMFRIDIYSAEGPQRCILVRGATGGALSKRPSNEQWNLYQTFFAYDKPIGGSTRYEVFESENPYRCKVVMHNHETVSFGPTKTTATDGPPGSRKQAMLDPLSTKDIVALKNNTGWISVFNFWAFYNPLPGTGRLNVQRVTNPIRERVTTENEVRGGWSNKFTFYGYFAIRIGVFSCDEPIWRQKVVNFPSEACQSAMIPHPPLSELSICSSEIEESQQFDTEEEQAVEKVTFWAREFEFFALGVQVQGCLRYNVVRARSPARYKIALDGEYSGWDLVTHFYAFSIPYPGTSAFIVQVARNPTRFRVQLGGHLVLKPWRELFTFYAFSTRDCDRYEWPMEVKS